MTNRLDPRTRKRLHIQGFDTIPDEHLAEVGPWLRFAFALCATLAAAGTIAASPALLLALAVIAAWAAASRVHPFDRVYNGLVRRFTGTRRLPPRGAPSRFACGFGAVWLVATAWAFAAGYALAGYVLGGTLTAVALLVSTTDICVPSMIYRFFSPGRRTADADAAQAPASGDAERP